MKKPQMMSIGEVDRYHMEKAKLHNKNAIITSDMVKFDAVTIRTRYNLTGVLVLRLTHLVAHTVQSMEKW